MVSAAIKLIASTTLLLVGSWLLVHTIAVGGALIALAYFVLWITFPLRVPCFLCRLRKNNTPCFGCGVVPKDGTTSHPRSLRCATYNMLVIMMLSAISLALVFVEMRVLHALKPNAPSTVSFVFPPDDEHYLGETFPLEIKFAEIETPINAVRADIQFDAERLEVVSVSTERSFASVFIQQEIDNEGGFVRLSGGLPSPGFTGKNGVFGTIYFRAKKPGIASIEYLPSSLALANNNQGVNILKSLSSTSYLILGEAPLGNAVINTNDASQENQEAVLGSQSDVNQMIFFENETIETSTPDTQELKVQDQAQESNMLSTGIELMTYVDENILVFWKNIPKALTFSSSR